MIYWFGLIFDLGVQLNWKLLLLFLFLFLLLYVHNRRLFLSNATTYSTYVSLHSGPQDMVCVAMLCHGTPLLPHSLSLQNVLQIKNIEKQPQSKRFLYGALFRRKDKKSNIASPAQHPTSAQLSSGYLLLCSEKTRHALLRYCTGRCSFLSWRFYRRC